MILDKCLIMWNYWAGILHLILFGLTLTGVFYV